MHAHTHGHTHAHAHTHTRTHTRARSGARPQAVLLSVHNFFDALGGEEIRKRGAREDKPLRMVKTVLHEL